MSLLLGSCEGCRGEVRTGQHVDYVTLRAGHRRRWLWWHRDCDDTADHRDG